MWDILEKANYGDTKKTSVAAGGAGRRGAAMNRWRTEDF